MADTSKGKEVRPKKFESINVIPFIDIMLVLLVIILTTASFIAKGEIPINLPQSKSAKTVKDKKSVIISIKKDGEILFDGETILREQLEETLSFLNRKDNIQINCDKEARFDNFVTLLDSLKRNGFENIAIVTRVER